MARTRGRRRERGRAAARVGLGLLGRGEALARRPRAARLNDGRAAAVRAQQHKQPVARDDAQAELKKKDAELAEKEKALTAKNVVLMGAMFMVAELRAALAALTPSAIAWARPKCGTFLPHSGRKCASKQILPPRYIFSVLPSSSGSASSGGVAG